MIKARSLTIGKWPMPPSSNHQYWNQILPAKAGGRMVARPTKSKDLKAWEKSMAEWFLKNERRIKEGRLFCLELQARGLMVRWDTYLCWPHPKLWYQNGTPARNDLHDRLKAQHDTLSQQMGFDDRRIFASYEEKVELKTIQDPFFFIVLSGHKPRMLQDIIKGEVPK